MSQFRAQDEEKSSGNEGHVGNNPNQVGAKKQSLEPPPGASSKLQEFERTLYWEEEDPPPPSLGGEQGGVKEDPNKGSSRPGGTNTGKKETIQIRVKTGYSNSNSLPSLWRH